MAVLVAALTLTFTSLADDISPSATLTIEKSANRLVLRGDVSSNAHEIILLQTADQYFAPIDKEFDLRRRQLAPPGWALVTELTLRALASTQSSIAKISVNSLIVRGITTDIKSWTAAIVRVEENLLPGMTFEQHVAEIAAFDSFENLCRRQFDSVTKNRKMEFSRMSSDLPGNAVGLLNALLEIAFDCPQARIQVTGHTDNTGAEASNLLLSQSRAESVMAYFVEHGLDESRISATGAGSSQPVTDNSTAYGRRQNRRIEFSLKFD